MSQHVIKNLKIKTATIKIKVVRVGGHKMTKATYDQILIDNETVLDNSVIIGYIKENYNAGFSIIFNTNKGLRKRYLESYIKYWRSKGAEGLNRLKKEFCIDEVDSSFFMEWLAIKYINDNKLDQLFIAT